MVKNRVKWPHEFVLTGTNKKRASYDQLTPVQWMAGFCRTVKEGSDLSLREHMLDYIKALFEDGSDFSWAAAKASHAVLPCRMEQGEVSDFSQVEKKLIGSSELMLKNITMVVRMPVVRHIRSKNQHIKRKYSYTLQFLQSGHL